MLSLGLVMVAACVLVVMALSSWLYGIMIAQPAGLAFPAFRAGIAHPWHPQEQWVPAGLAKRRSLHMYPSLRSSSILRPSSCARPARSATVVCRNSSMMSSTDLAVDLIGNVQGAQPRLRYR